MTSCNVPGSYNDKPELGACICEYGQTDFGNHSRPRPVLKIHYIFWSIFSKIDGIAQEMKNGLQGITLAPTMYFFFHTPDMAICGSMHDRPHSESYGNLTLPTQQMLRSIFWVKTLNKSFDRSEEVKLRWSFLFVKHSALGSDPTWF